MRRTGLQRAAKQGDQKRSDRKQNDRKRNHRTRDENEEKRAQPRARSGIARAAGVLAASILLASCSGALDATRRHTYAPDFNYITDAQLQGAMWQLAAGTSRLDQILASGSPVSFEERRSVIQILQSMQAAADSLGPEGWPSNHPRITEHLPRFQEQLARAVRNVQLEPPSYYLAGTISGACHACHGGQARGPGGPARSARPSRPVHAASDADAFEIARDDRG